ncbi:hypothetical protein [Fluviicola taffensis]|uniref:DUF4836 family protein n=1 Tax=Fluviicola taffensis (strain DSM 16823 / NCIMB 13979 / RW262) TaxID=755732 RepID=F2IGL4_FLUTR|nr:hypothetical protein [Fluviicola taffensis]AEA42620.1 hypothetical protein Fluta_0616 [Fluviicola taffensis DSM 16823]
MKKHIKALIFSIFAFSGILITSSCSSDSKERDAAEATSALIEANEKIVAFGHVDAMNILNNSDYKNIPKVNIILGSVLGNWKKGLEIDKPIYYALEAPFSQNGTPESVYAIINIKNKDSLSSIISEMGYSLEKEGDISFHQEDDVTFGIREKLLIIISKPGDYDGKVKIKEAFTFTEGDLSEDKTQEIIEQKGDIVAGVDIARLFTTSNTSLENLPADKKDELTNLVEDAFVKTVVNFENGAINFESNNLFSDELKDKLFFKDKNGSTLVSQLGGGNPWMGVAVNLDLRKGEDFISSYLPDGKKDLISGLPTEVKFALLTLGENPLSKLFSGQAGFVLNGDPKSAMGMELEYSSFLGMGPKGEILQQLLKEQFGAFGIKNGDTYEVGELKVKLAKKGIYASSGKGNSGKINLPSYAKNFGEDSFSMFIAFEKMDVASLELEDEAKVIEILQYMTVNVNRDGTKVIVAAKNKNTNILKQIKDYYTKQIMDKIDGMGA